MPEIIDKIKNAFTHPDTQKERSALSGHHDDRDEVDLLRAQHTKSEALADERIHEREVEEASEPRQPWQPPVISGGRPSLEEAAHPERADHKQGEQHAAHPDMAGVYHVPESELPIRYATVHTALRPEDPDQPGAMDGRGEPSTAGDDLAI